MADNVVRFRRPEKKPETPRPGGQKPDGRKPGRPAMSQGRLSLLAWAAIVGIAIAIVAAQQSGLLGG